MATEAQVAANRRNAARSTGSRAEAGKMKARGNALKHGGRATTLDVMPVLPHEDPKALEERTAAWLDEWQLGDGSADDLARRGALLAWKLERAVAAAEELGRRLNADGRDGLLASLPRPPWPDAPGPLVARLEETAAGCRWLIEYFRDLSSSRDPAFKWATAWRELAPRPADRSSAEASGGCGGGSPGEPAPQEGQGAPRGEDDQPSADREVSVDESTTNEAKLGSTQGTTGEEFTSSEGRHDDDERTQSARVGESGIAADGGHDGEEETGGGDHESDESHESVGRRREEAAYLPRDTGNGNPKRMS